jgi:hypothetical protein
MVLVIHMKYNFNYQSKGLNLGKIEYSDPFLIIICFLISIVLMENHQKLILNYWLDLSNIFKLINLHMCFLYYYNMCQSDIYYI